MLGYKRFVVLTLALLISSNVAMASEKYQVSRFNNSPIKEIAKYHVEVPNNLNQYTKGLVAGIGSSLSFKGITSQGEMEFYTLTDRGPNLEAPIALAGQDIKIFPNPDFLPFIGVVKVKPGNEAILTQAITLSQKGKTMTGLPLPNTKEVNNREIALDLSLNQIPSDKNGIDPESVATDKEGNFWIGEEYGPSIIKVSKEGKVLKKLMPGKGLPEIFKFRQKNKGFEAIAVAPNGKIYTAIEGTLDINQETKDKANFIFQA
jgi:hypothetical protein